MDIEKIKDTRKAILKEIRNLEKLKEEITGEIDVLTEEVENINTAQSLRLREEKKQDMTKKLTELEDSMTDINERIDNKGNQRDALDKALEEKDKDMKNIKYRKIEEKKKIEDLEKEVQDLERQANHKLAVIDRFAPKVALEISNAAKRFTICPIGPVGKFIQLNEKSGQNENLQKLIETELGSNILRAYLCDNDNDRIVLWDIMNRVYGGQKKPQVFTSRFLYDRHNVMRVMGGHNTMMDFIEISGSPREQAVIFNCLVDQKGIEAIVVKETQTEASKLCTFLNNVPRNMNYCITEDFYRYFPPTNTTSYRSYFFEKTSTRILGCDMNSKIREKKELMNASKVQAQKLKVEEEKNLKVRQEIEKQIGNLRTEIQRFREELGELSKQKSKLKAEQNSVDDVDSLQLKLNERKSDREKLDTELQGKVNEKDNLSKKLEDKLNDHKMAMKELSKNRESVNPYESEKRKIEGKMASKRQEIVNQETILRRMSTEIKGYKEKLKTVISLGKELSQACNRVKVTTAELKKRPSGTAAEISAKLKNLRVIKKKKNPCSTDEEDLFRQFLELKERCDKNEKQLKDLEEMADSLNKMLTARHETFYFIRDMITKMVKRRFSELSVTFQEQVCMFCKLLWPLMYFLSVRQSHQHQYQPQEERAPVCVPK